MEKIVLSDNYADYKGMTIPKGTTLFINKVLPISPFGTEPLEVFVDNGTGLIETMPKTIVQRKPKE